MMRPLIALLRRLGRFLKTLLDMDPVYRIR